MVIAFDPTKDAKNRAKHGGLSLALAAEFDWVAGVVYSATRARDSEDRWKLLVRHEGVAYATIFTRRGDVYRIISLRRASRKERRFV